MQVLPAENYQLKSRRQQCKNKKKEKEEEKEKVKQRGGGWWGNEGSREREQSHGAERRKTVRLCMTCK